MPRSWGAEPDGDDFLAALRVMVRGSRLPAPDKSSVPARDVRPWPGRARLVNEMKSVFGTGARGDVAPFGGIR